MKKEKKEEKENMQRKEKRVESKEKGITLVALVITIVVLLLLAGVTISLLVGDNGIITKTREAKNKTEQTQQNELKGLDDMEIQIEEALGNGYNEQKGVNAPKLASNMKLVTFNEENNTWLEDTTQNAYNYLDTSIPGNENKSKWANAEVTVDGITSYFVWIPRYAYNITYYTNENKTEISETPTAYGTIDVKFIKGTGNIATDGTVCVYASENPDRNDYIIHPAFTTNENYGGGWNNELSGIWIGKYEASLANKEDGNNIITDNANIGNISLTDDTDKVLVTKPGYSSWRCCTIGNMYTNALTYDTNLKSHMLKSSEWGVVAYLTESKYGRNGIEVMQNTDENYITGGGTGNKYATVNINQSSTGNVYGIYDINGGAFEYVASYLKNGDFSYAESTFTNNSSDAYSTAYDTENINESYKYGDATYETAKWHKDVTNFVNSTYSFFNFGGRWSASIDNSGIFCFNNGSGNDDASIFSFRVALVY